MGIIGYVLFFLLVGGALMALLAVFSGSLALAAGLVGLMVGYMLLAGWVVEGKLDRRD
jgi:hypothetical protein